MRLIDYLPEFYANSPEVVSIQQAIEYQVAALRAARDELMEQLNVISATWGLKLWERDLAIISKVEDSLDFRRTRIMSKLRGAGTTTEAMIKNVAESFSYGEVEIVTFPAEFRFEIRFVGTLGIPPNMDDLTAAIEEIKPAHLAYSFIFTFMTWAMFEDYNHTWAEWDALNLTWDEFEVYKE